MKTKLLRKIRNKYHIKYSHICREWCLDDKNYKHGASYHHSFCVIISAALHGIYYKRKADRLSEFFFNKTHRLDGRGNSEYKILSRWKYQTTKTK